MHKDQILAIFLAALLAGASAAAAAADEPTPTPTPVAPGIDWKSLIDTDMSGDHVVGEELCARPR